MRASTTPLIALGLLAAGCSGSGGEAAEREVSLYVALDQVYSEPILELFEERTGIQVNARYDTEANKTVGLVNAIIAEAERPRADAFWNNEIANTIRLQRLGLTAPYVSPAARELPAEFRDPGGHWTGFAARARIILYRDDLLGQDESPPRRIDDMILPKYAAQGGMAKPLTGTTLTHFAGLCALRGAQPVLEWLAAAKASPLHLGKGNAYVMKQVSEKDYAWCLTDTDDAAASRRNGHPVRILYPDQGEGELGTMLIPNTVCILEGAPHREEAERLVDFLLSAEVEERLARSGSDQIPLRAGVPVPEHVKVPGEDFRVMQVDWKAVAQQIEERLPEFQELFLE